MIQAVTYDAKSDLWCDDVHYKMTSVNLKNDVPAGFSDYFREVLYKIMKKFEFDKALFVQKCSSFSVQAIQWRRLWRYTHCTYVQNVPVRYTTPIISSQS